MKSKIFFGIFIIIAVILSAGIVSAADLNGTEVDEIEDYRFSDSDMEKINREYEVFEVEQSEKTNFEKYYTISYTSKNNGDGTYTATNCRDECNITIMNNVYIEHRVRNTYNYKWEYGKIVDLPAPTKSYDYGKTYFSLEYGYNILDLVHGNQKNDYDAPKKVCVILHGYTIINTDEPVYKTVTINTNKKVISHYKKIPHYKTFKSWDYAKSPKKLKSMIKWRCRNGDFECCAMGTFKLVKFYQKQLYKNGVKLVKFKIKRLSKYNYSPQYGHKIAKFKFNVKVKYYTLKPVYKTVTVKSTSDVFSHYKKIGKIW